MPVTGPPRYARYHAPSESGQRLVVPTWDELPSLAAAGAAWRASADCELMGRGLSNLADEARGEVLREAGAYVASYLPDAGGGRAPDFRQPLILTGHQPELVHPGVWLKNFAAGALAAKCGGAAINLVIDGDLCRRTSILVPSGGVDSPQAMPVEFDRPAPAAAWEERRVLDVGLWESFPTRVREIGGSLISDPFLDQWWPTAVERSRDTGSIGGSFAQARHMTEHQWGSRTLEMPQSRMCRTAAFRWFVCHLLVHLPRFAAAHNTALADYRRSHHIRNRAHPAPKLTEQSGWIEAPLWMWSTGDPRRRPVFARRQEGKLWVSDRRAFERPLSADENGDPAVAIAELGKWEGEGVKIRSRALVTTMFARLAVADLFIHGIGGAKYDEATDDICQRFFGVTPPRFATMSGTLRLPIDHPTGGVEEVRRQQQCLRDLEFHPERIVAESSDHDGEAADLAEWIRQKRGWLDVAKTPANAAERHRAIVEANGHIHAALDPERRAAEANLLAAIGRAHGNRVLEGREYAFCLFPRDSLQGFLLDFVNPMP